MDINYLGDLFPRLPGFLRRSHLLSRFVRGLVAIAAAFGLAFLPLHRSRYDLVVLQSYLDEPPVQRLLSTLDHRRVLSQLQALGGFDTSQTGEVMAIVHPPPAR